MMFYVYMPYLSLSMIRYDWIVLFWAEEWIRTWNLFFCYEIKLGDNDIPHIYINIYIHIYWIYLVWPRRETKQRRLEVQFLGEPFGSPQLGLSQRFEHGLLCGEAAGQGDGWPLNEEKTKTPG